MFDRPNTIFLVQAAFVFIVMFPAINMTVPISLISSSPLSYSFPVGSVYSLLDEQHDSRAIVK